MVRDQMRSGPGVVGWSLPDDEVGDVRARLPFAGDDPDDARTPWCPVCSARTTMRAVVTPTGRRFDLCDGCGLLLHVDRAHGRVVAHRVVAPRLSHADRPATEWSPAGPAGHVPPPTAATPAPAAAPSARVRRPHRRAGARRPRAGTGGRP